MITLFSEFIAGQAILFKTGVVSTDILVHDWIGTLVMGEAIISQGYELGFQGNPIDFLCENFPKNQIKTGYHFCSKCYKKIHEIQS